MKRFVAVIVILCLLLSVAATFAACDPKTPAEEKDYTKLNVLFLGDSIAEAIAGPSPVEQRQNYGYYGILGQINGYNYENRAISGNQTNELLAYVEREDEDGYLTRSLIGGADVICISITGNDLLWHNFPLMMYELAARERFGADYVDRPEVQACYEYHRYQVVEADGTMRTITKEDDLTDPDSPVRALKPGDGIATFESVIATATRNVDKIIDALRRQNPNATILFQNVYNPVDDESEMIPMDLVNDMMVLDAKYDFSTEAGVAEYRRWGGYMLGALSDLLKNAAAAHDKVEFVDVAKAFDDIYVSEADHARGKGLIFEDGVHPSDRGHAVIAATLQTKLIELGLAEGTKSLANYKELRVKQLGEMYRGVTGFDYDAAVAACRAGATMDDVSKAYFAATDAYTPIISSSPIEGKATNGIAVAAEETYELSRVVSRRATHAEQLNIDGYFDLAAMFIEEKSLKLKTDGTLEMKIVVPLENFMPLLATAANLDGMVIGGKEDTFYMDEEGNLTNLMMSGAKDAYSTVTIYADAIFPGLGSTAGTFGANFHLLYDSLGLGIEGLDVLMAEPYVDEAGLPMDMAPEGTVDPTTVGRTYASYIDYVIAYLGRYQEVVDADGKTLHVDKLPAGFTAKISELTTVTVRLSTVYSLRTFTGADGAEVQAIYCGPYDEKTAPWMVMTKYADEEGNAHVKMNFEVLGFVLEF